MKKAALIIGISKYTYLPELWNTENDAVDVSEFLKSVGFQTSLILNATQRDIIRQLAFFKNSLENDTISIIYFAGHGLQINGNNYLVPTDAEISISEEIPYLCIDAADCLIDQGGFSNSTHLLILDACRNNPFKNGIRAVNTGLAKMQAPMGTLIAFSTSPNSTSLERKNDRNGIYTQYLLKNLKIPNCVLERIFKNTRTEVIKSTSGKQVPWEESSLHGEDFYFIKEPTALIYLIRKDLIFVYQILAEKNIDLITFDANVIESILQPEKIKVSFFEAISLLRLQWEHSNNTKHTSVAFFLIFNLQNIIMATKMFRMLTKNINFIKLNDFVVQQSREINDIQLVLIQKLLLLVENYASIYQFNDKFGNLKSLKREYKNKIWTGLKMNADILENQELFLKDLEFIRLHKVHLNEFFNSKILIDVMDEFFTN